MKKIGSVLSAAFAAAFLAVGIGLHSIAVFADVSPAVTISGSEGTSPVTYTYSPDTQTTNTKSIKELFTGLSNLANGDLTQSITVLSDSSTPVKFWLRLSVKTEETSDALPKAEETTPEPDADSVLDYYTIQIMSADGKTVYDSTAESKSSPYDTYKDMELLTLNNDAETDSAEYEIKISINSDLSDLSESALKLDWQIVSDAVSAAAPTEIGENVNDGVILTKGSYIVGDDIAAGKYFLTGDSTVKVYTEDGDLKTNIILSSDSDTGIGAYTLNINDGETVNLSADTLFSATSSAPASAASMTVNSEESAAKDNMYALWIVIAAVIFAAAIVIIRKIKRKKKYLI